MTADPSYLWPGYTARSASFENPTAAPSAGGTIAGGRKGAPQRLLAPGERVVLADLSGPGRVGHIWLTVALAGGPGRFHQPRLLRSQLLEAFYDDLHAPSISVPVGDFFGAVHGVPVAYASALTAVNEGRGFSSRVPLPFRRQLRLEYENGLDEPVILYYQVDALLGPLPDECGLLHAGFRRQNPTALADDFVVTDGLAGPGRFLGWTGGVRVLDESRWWGEGELKVFFDGETLPSICGTGTEDYLNSAWGLGSFAAPESGAPLVWSRRSAASSIEHSWAGFYRWHLSDPIVYERSLRVTIQQIGMAAFRAGQEAELERFRAAVRPAGHGWSENPARGVLGMSLYERQDDWCATAFVYAQRAQPVQRLDRAAALADLPNPADGQLLVQRPPSYL